MTLNLLNIYKMIKPKYNVMECHSNTYFPAQWEGKLDDGRMIVIDKVFGRLDYTIHSDLGDRETFSVPVPNIEEDDDDGCMDSTIMQLILASHLKFNCEIEEPVNIKELEDKAKDAVENNTLASFFANHYEDLKNVNLQKEE